MEATETMPAWINPEPQPQHRWVHKLLGEWTWEHDCPSENGKPAEKFTGTESVRSLGGLWVVCEGKGNVPGCGEANTLMTLGYDPAKKRFIGTWIGSMMTHMWVYDGELDAAEKVLTLNCEGPSFTEPGKMARYRDVIEFKSDDHRVLTSHTQGADGKWTQFMTAHYRRRK